ncbi:MAG: J domain-containing protein [Bacteroidota bacterium]
MIVDHYAILCVSPSANREEIKNAYRKLARQYHPDLNPNDIAATDRFRDIQTAYETLTRPHLRQAYMEKRWYAQFKNESLETEALTLERILQKCIQLERFVDSLDPHRMDREGLAQHIRQEIRNWISFLPDGDKDRTTLETILQLTIHCCRHLSVEACKAIQQDLRSWLRSCTAIDLLTEDWLLKKEKWERWQRWVPLGIMLLTLTIAGIIWIAAK